MKLFAIFLIITTFAISTANSQWVQTSGPGGIDINALYKSGSLILAGTDALGAFRSTNSGATWFSASGGIEGGRVKSFAELNGDFYAAYPDHRVI